MYSTNPVEMVRINSLDQFKPVLYKADFFPPGYDGPNSEYTPKHPKLRYFIDLEDFHREFDVALKAKPPMRVILPGKRQGKTETKDTPFFPCLAKKGKKEYVVMIFLCLCGNFIYGLLLFDWIIFATVLLWYYR